MFKQITRLTMLSLIVLSTTACRKKKTVVMAEESNPTTTPVHVEQRVSGVMADTTVEWSEADLK